MDDQSPGAGLDERPQDHVARLEGRDRPLGRVRLDGQDRARRTTHGRDVARIRFRHDRETGLAVRRNPIATIAGGRSCLRDRLASSEA